jgi:hypothetical protein
MDPFLGPVAGALLAALGAGGALGVVRLRRLSLDWWRRRAARATAPPEPAADAAATAPSLSPADDAPDPSVAPPVFSALGAVALAALTVAGLALAVGAAGGPAPGGAPLALPPLAGAPSSLAAFAARSSALVGFALATVLATLGLALAASALDRGLARLGTIALRKLRGDPRAGGEERLAVPDLVSAARSLLPGAAAPTRGEPFGVGLAYVVLLAAAALGAGSLLAAAGAPDRRDLSGFAALAALGLLATPALYAAAAERSRDPLRARLRRDAAVRQLAVAPAWAIAGGVFAVAPSLAAPGPVPAAIVAIVSFVVFAATVAVALPGAGADPGAWSAPPLGGDRAEPAAAVRALTGLAHYAWIVVALVLPFVLRARDAAAVPAALATGAAAVLGFLAARAALRRFAPAPAPAPPLAPGGAAA